MALTMLALVLVLGGSPKTRVITESFDSLPRGGAPKGWTPLGLDRGPLGIWGANTVSQPGSWPQALIQDGRPFPPRWAFLALPGSYESFSCRVLVGGGKPGSGAAGLAVLNARGQAVIFAGLAGGAGFAGWEKDALGRWQRWDIPAEGPVQGPWLIFLSGEKSGSPLKASWGTVDKIRGRDSGRAGVEPPWTLALAARTDGKWWFDDLKLNGKLQMTNGK